MPKPKDNQTPDQQDNGAASPQASDQSPGQQVDWHSEAQTLQTELEQMKSRYSGQQAVLQEAQESKSALSNKVDELTANLNRLQHELSEAVTGKTEIETQFEEVQSKAQKLEAQQTKMDLVRKEYPDLLRFPLDALPDADNPDDLGTKLAEFNEAVSSIVEEKEAQIKAQYTEGAVPTPPAAQGEKSGALGETEEEARERLNELAGTPEYDDALEEYLEILSQSPADKKYRIADDSLSGEFDDQAL